MTPKHLEARRYALDGIPVFPCEVDGKRPACENGFHDATTNLEQIDAWWNAADYNLALCPADAGWCVVDIDPGGLEPWRDLCREHGTPDEATTTVRTPRGGAHLYFTGELPPTSSKLAEHIDTRGRGSYVLVPPSSVDGVSYTWKNDHDTAPVPTWVQELAIAKRDHQSASIEELDLPDAIRRARDILLRYVSRGDVAREGSGGDNRTYTLAAELLSLGLTAQTALDLIEEIWNPHCVPPWTHDELSVKIENASRYMQNEAGAFGVGTAEEAFGDALDKLKAEQASDPQSRSRFWPISLSELPAALKPPSWIIPDLIPRSSTIQVLGKQKSFKTFLTLDLALGIASGRETFGHKPDQAPVVYAVGENASAFGLRHIPAWRLARDASEPFPFFVVPTVPRVRFPDEAIELVEQVKKRGIAPELVVIDTATRALRGMNENDAKDMGELSECCDFIKDQLACSVILIRHTGKDLQRGGRGSNVIEGDFDTMLKVERHDKTLAVSVTVDEQRNAQEREEPYTFEGRPIAQSLVFFPVSAAQFSQFTRKEHTLSKRNVGKALAGLGAFGRDHSVTTPVLAAELVPMVVGETAEARQETLGRACKALNALARTVLLAYSEAIGRDRLWYLPEAPADQDEL